MTDNAWLCRRRPTARIARTTRAVRASLACAVVRGGAGGTFCCHEARAGGTRRRGRTLRDRAAFEIGAGLARHARPAVGPGEAGVAGAVRLGSSAVVRV